MENRKNIFFGLLITVSLLLAIGCDMGGSEDGATTYAIGDIGPSGIGIVFYIKDGGLHGLEAVTSDQSSSQVWIAGGSTQSTLNGNTSDAIGTGLANSNAIIAQDGHIGSAAQVCRDYNGGGLNDWFLPSIEELRKLYYQKDTVGGFEVDWYWSSSECSSSGAWAQSFGDNSIRATASKSPNALRVRAIRAF